MLEAQCGQAWELKTPGKPCHWGPHTSVTFTSGIPTKYSEWRLRKNPLVIPKVRGESSHVEICPENNSLDKVFPEEKLFWPGEKTYPSPAPACHAVLPEGGKGNWESLVEFTVHRPTLTKRLRSDHRTIGCFPTPHQKPQH